MGYALRQTIEMVDMECVNCGTPFAWPKTLKEARLRDGQNFYCPNGHIMSWTETEAMRLRKMLDEANRKSTALAQQVREAQEAEQRAVDERKRVEREAKRIKRRIQGGVCPCCNRTFINLGRHMKTKHPDPA